MKIAVLGGMGLMAEAALHDLAGNPRVTEVIAADIHLDRASAVLSRIPQRNKIKTLKVDLNDTARAVKALKGSDCLLNASWYEYNLKAMELALRLKAHYADLGGLYHMTLKQLKRDREFRQAGLTAVLGIGSTPGITNMMVARMAPDFETIDTVGIYDASHDPSLDDSSFIPPFSIRTMLDEYVMPAPIWQGGRIQEVQAHGQPETMEFKAPIGRVTAGTVIHSEPATLPGYLKARGVKNLFFKIVYPESVKRQLALLVGMGFSGSRPVPVNGHSVSPRGFVTALARASAAAAGTQGAPHDYEVLRVKISGSARGRELIKTWDCEIQPTKKLSAGAMGVGFAGAIAAAMLAGRQTLRAGAAGPESLLDHGIFFKELKTRRVFRLAETVAHPLSL